MRTREEVIKIKNSKFRFILNELDRDTYGIYRCLVLLSDNSLKDDRKELAKILKLSIKHLFRTFTRIFKPYNKY